MRTLVLAVSLLVLVALCQDVRASRHGSGEGSWENGSNSRMRSGRTYQQRRQRYWEESRPERNRQRSQYQESYDDGNQRNQDSYNRRQESQYMQREYLEAVANNRRQQLEDQPRQRQYQDRVDYNRRDGRLRQQGGYDSSQSNEGFDSIESFESNERSGAPRRHYGLCQLRNKTSNTLLCDTAEFCPRFTTCVPITSRPLPNIEASGCFSPVSHHLLHTLYTFIPRCE